MAMSSVLTLLLFGLVFCMQALEQRSAPGRYSKQESLASSMCSIFSNVERRLAALEVRFDNSTEEPLAPLEATMEGELQEKLQDMDAKLQGVQDGMQRLESMVNVMVEKMAEMVNTSSTSMMGNPEACLLPRVDNNMAQINTSIARMEQTTKELMTRMSAVEDKLDNATSFLAEELKNTRTRSCDDVQRQTENLNNQTIEADGTEGFRRTCQDYYDHGQRSSGTYKLLLEAGQSPMQVYCDMSNDAGWVVFQRRQDGSVDFYRNWTSYEDGFGNFSGEFWLGNRNIHRLTSAGLTQLRVDLQAWNGSTAFASYSHFSVGDASSFYRLSVSGYSGTAGDGLTSHSGHKFTTFDRDNDIDGDNCAQERKGAYWYHSCTSSNLNGEYGARGSSGDRYVFWDGFSMYRQSLQRTELKLK